MLRRSLRVMAVNPYALFMIEQKTNPKLVGLPVPKRGRATARLYRALPRKERAALERRAAKRPAFKRVATYRRRGERSPRKPSKFALFVSRHYNDKPLRNLTPPQKLKAISKLWNLQKAGVLPERMLRTTKAKTSSARKQLKAAASKPKAKTPKRAASPTRSKASKKHQKSSPIKTKGTYKKKATMTLATRAKNHKTSRKSRSLVKGRVLII